MPGQASSDLFSQAVDLFAQRVSDYADGIAQRLGQPMSGQQLNKDQVLERWNFSPVGDQQQADAQYHTLVAQGMAPGQALDQVYPMRKMLFTGPDLNAQIQTAQQIASWDAAAKGTDVQTADVSQLPHAQWLQNLQPQTAPPQLASQQLGPGAGPLPGSPPGPGMGGPPPGIGPTPGSGLPLPVAQPAPGPLPGPSVAPLPMGGPTPGAMPPITPVPGVSS